MSKTGGRYVEVFQKSFQTAVELWIEAGLVWGEGLYMAAGQNLKQLVRQKLGFYLQT